MSASRRCPRCQGELSSAVAEGLCPGCLLREALTGPDRESDRAVSRRPPAPVFVPPTPAELAPHFPQLEIARLVGQGGMGAVYLARQPELDRLVAVKVLPPEVAHDGGFTERFSREARSLARLNHPNIVTIFDFGAADGLYYFTMEYVDGKNVRELLAAGELTPALALRIVAQVCDALQFAHDEGFVHRDIKPENILVDRKGRVKIADFGVARLVGMTPYLSLTGSRDVLGTLYYMAPEQLKGAHAVDHRADLYSLGVVFYEMLTGELPVGRFAAPSQGAGVDARLDAIVLRALSREPGHRYQDAAQIKREVEAVLAGEPAAEKEGPAPVRSVWPCVRFTIPNISWMGAWAQGEMFRDETTLYLDFSVVNSLGTSTHKAVRIPLAEILTISCHAAAWPGLPHWIRAWKKPEIVLKVYTPAALADLPAGPHGRGRLRAHPGDLEAAQQLVDSILRSPLPRPAENIPAAGGPVGNADRVRRQLRGPVIGLLLTSVAALACTVGAAALAPWLDLLEGLPQWMVVVIASVLALVNVGVLLPGAVQMLRRRSYTLCVAAAFLAVLPWSPAWLVGLPVGIWALVVLSRTEVILAFLRDRGGAPPGPAADPPPPGPVAGKLRSWWRSLAGYLLTTYPGTRARKGDAKD